MSATPIAVAPVGKVTAKGSQPVPQATDVPSDDGFSRQLQKEVDLYLEGSVKEIEVNDSQLPTVTEGASHALQTITERLAIGEEVDIAGVVVMEEGKSILSVAQSQLTTAENLPQSGKILPSNLPPSTLPFDITSEGVLPALADTTAKSGMSVANSLPEVAVTQYLPIKSNFANQSTGQQQSEVVAQKLQPSLAQELRFSTAQHLPIKSDFANQLIGQQQSEVVAQKLQPSVAQGLRFSTTQHLPIRSDFANNQLIGQQQVEVAAQNLESTLAQGLRFSINLEQPATQSLSGVGLASAGLLSPSAISNPVAGGAILPESAVPRSVISMNTPLGEPGWTQEMGSRLQVLVERGNQRAEIRLNPPELGFMEVKVHNDGERTNVTFFAQNATTREALEAAMPRLREMFGENGLQLADANVSQQQSMADEREQSKADGGSGFGDIDADTEVSELTVNERANGLVDYYI